MYADYLDSLTRLLGLAMHIDDISYSQQVEKVGPLEGIWTQIKEQEAVQS